MQKSFAEAFRRIVRGRCPDHKKDYRETTHTSASFPVVPQKGGITGDNVFEIPFQVEQKVIILTLAYLANFSINRAFEPDRSPLSY